jgi:hypothetical protein
VNAAQIDRLIRATSLSLLAALSILLFLVFDISEDSSHFVPVNVSLTLTFFCTTAGVILFCSKTAMGTEGVDGVRNGWPGLIGNSSSLLSKTALTPA